jgi:hypothetical protein
MRVTGASAQITLDGMRDVLARRRRIALQQLHPRQDHAGRAITALQTVAFPESFLHRMQLPVVGQSFDGGDLGPICLHGEERARLHCLAVHQHGARAAERGFAADVRAGEVAVLAKEMNEQGAWLDFALSLHSVNFDPGEAFHGCSHKKLFPCVRVIRVLFSEAHWQ